MPIQNEWPKLDPITNRKICESCFNGVHRHKFLRYGKLRDGSRYDIYKPANDNPNAEDACDGECDCIHKSELTFAQTERTQARENSVAKKKLMQESQAQSPLRVS